MLHGDETKTRKFSTAESLTLLAEATQRSFVDVSSM